MFVGVCVAVVVAVLVAVLVFPVVFVAVLVAVLVGVEAPTMVVGVTDKLRVQLTATPRRVVIARTLMICQC